MTTGLEADGRQEPAILLGRQRLCDLVEHGFQPAIVHVLVGDERDNVVLTLGHLRPVQAPAGVPGDQRPEDALRAAIALTERVQGVEVVEADGQPLDELVSIQALQHMIIVQRRLGVSHARVEQLQGLEDAATAFAHVDGAGSAPPTRTRPGTASSGSTATD